MLPETHLGSLGGLLNIFLGNQLAFENLNKVHFLETFPITTQPPSLKVSFATNKGDGGKKWYKVEAGYETKSGSS